MSWTCAYDALAAATFAGCPSASRNGLQSEAAVHESASAGLDVVSYGASVAMRGGAKA